jgi:hypothetical protein
MDRWMVEGWLTGSEAKGGEKATTGVMIGWGDEGAGL